MFKEKYDFYHVLGIAGEGLRELSGLRPVERVEWPAAS
jgi:hypothetical protein